MVRIVGSGMAGLLAGCMFRLDGQIYEAAPSLPNNHHALLRFRSDEIGRYLNIPFQKVDVMKMVKPWRNRVADAVAYAQKCTGRMTLRSSVSAEGKIEQRFIAPPDFIQQMERHQNNEPIYNHKVDRSFFEVARAAGEQVISTVPMPLLMQLLGYETELQFAHSNGIVIKIFLPWDCDVCATFYYPDPEFLPSRASLTGTFLQIEIPLLTQEQEFDSSRLSDRSWTLSNVVGPVLHDFGMPSAALEYELHKQRYNKILPIDDRERKKFIMWATDQWGVYSLGRFATWRPGLLLDSVFHDVQVIQSMIPSTNYERKKS